MPLAVKAYAVDEYFAFALIGPADLFFALHTLKRM